MEKIDRRVTDRRADDQGQIDRRVADRFSLPLKGTAMFTIGGVQDERDITTKTISAYGAYFESALRPDVSATVLIRLPIEQSEGRFEAKATVVRVEQLSKNTFGIAIKFQEILDFG